DTYRARFDGLPASDEALVRGHPLVLPAPAGTGATLVLPFGSRASRPDTSALVGALHVILPDGGLPDADVNLARALAALAGVAFAHARQAGRLARVARLKGDALSAMAHDLRAPLNALVGYTSLLGEGAFGTLTDEQSQVAATLQRQAIELVDLLAPRSTSPASRPASSRSGSRRSRCPTSSRRSRPALSRGRRSTGSSRGGRRATCPRSAATA